MYKFGRGVVKLRIPILIVAVLLLIPAAFGYLNTGVNYDLLTYLPKQIDTMKGQDILKDEFGKGAFSLIVTEGMDDQQVKELTEEIQDVPHVASALSYADLTSSSHIPDEAIPSKVREKLSKDGNQMIAVFFDDGTSAESTLDAIAQIRGIADKDVFVSSMSAFVLDLKNIADEEEPAYVAVAVICAMILLLFLTDSFLAPFIFLLSIAMAIVYNLGSNIFFGEISYITKALAAVLQLAVTMDYSIFLWTSFEENIRKYEDHKEAMAHAIAETLVAIFSSSMTATAGFLAMCFMTFTIGFDLGIVMAKGCVMGLIASVTILPALILFFEKPMLKTRHKRLIPDVSKLGHVVTSKPFVITMLCLFVLLAVPALHGFNNKPMYYDFTSMVVGEDSNLDESQTQFYTANQKLKEDFNVATTEMILCSSDMKHEQAKEMLDKIGDLDGVAYAIGFDSVRGGQVPIEAYPSELRDELVSGDYQLILINSEFDVSSDEENNQINQINSILKSYDPDGMLIGEAPAVKDLTEIMDSDFVKVDGFALIAVLAIIALAFGSGTIPFVLVLVIELAIMINLGLPYYLNTRISFIAPIVISTIQLGSCVNYAILVTTRYKRERMRGLHKRDAVSIAFATSFPAVVTSGMSFFAATAGVAVYAQMGIIKSICELLARGAVLSTILVLFMLPAFLMAFDGLIVRTSRGLHKALKQGTLDSITLDALVATPKAAAEAEAKAKTPGAGEIEDAGKAANVQVANASDDGGGGPAKDSGGGQDDQSDTASSAHENDEKATEEVEK